MRRKIVLLIAFGVCIMIMACSNETTQKPPQESKEDLIAYYSFNNPSDPGHDDSGNGHNLTMLGAGSIVPGKSGNAVHFETSNREAPHASTSGMKYPGSKGFSVGYWLKIGSSNDGIAVRDYWAHRDSGETFGLRYDPTQSKADFFVRHAFSPPTIVETTLSGKTGDWVSLLGTYDPDGYVIKLYVNDVLVGQKQMPGPMRDPIAPELYINGSFHGTNQGTMDEVKMFSSVVSKFGIP